MTRILVLALVLVACTAQPAFAGLLEALPAPSSLPPYVAPRSVLDEQLHLPAGEAPDVEAARVCYGPAAHLRLTLALQLTQPLSDERSRVAWLYGWRDAQEKAAAAFDREHTARLQAEATVTAYDARFQATERSEDWAWWRQLVTGIGIFGLGGLVGALAWGASR